MSEIQRADPTARRRAIFIVLVCTVLGAALAMVTQSYQGALEAWVLGHKEDIIKHPGVVALCFFVPLLPVLACAAYLWRFAARMIVTERFPPIGAKVIRDTAVLSGRAAVIRGRLLQFLVGILALSCLLIPAVIWGLIRSL